MDETWTIAELVEEVARRIAALPAPKNGQVRAVPDDRTIRYYATIGLLDRPIAMRGRTALYGRKHVAQVVAIKRLQTMERSLAEIQELWPTLDDLTLSRMSGVELTASQTKSRGARKDFWKAEPSEPVPLAPAPAPLPRAVARYIATPAAGSKAVMGSVTPVPADPLELRIALAPNISLSIALSDDDAITPADVAAIRAAAAPLIAELARRQLAMQDE